MALAMLTRTAFGAGSVCSRAASARPAKVLFAPTVVQRFLGVRPDAAPKGKKPAPPPPPPEEEYMEEGEDYFNPMDELTATQRRRVLAMKEVQKQYDTLHKDYLLELAQLQHKYNHKYAPLYDERLAIFSAKKAVTQTFDVEDDGEPDGPVPDFWLNALANHNKIGPYITERDSEVLKHLEDLRCEVLTGEDRGFKLLFHFKKDNPFFTNTVLEKVYELAPEDDVVPKRFTGTVINWKEGRDVTVEEQKRRVKGGKGDKGKPAFVVEKVPCDSFFSIFDPPQVPTDAAAAEYAEEELEEIEGALSDDIEIGWAIKDQVVPRAVEWFTGELAPMSPDEYDDEYEEGEY